MDDLKRLLDAVREMRAAQKLEMDALPSNLRIWKRARQKQTVSLLEQKVDEMAAELLRKQNGSGSDKPEPPTAKAKT